jgi:superfamily II DNA or RNA helicase
MGAFKLRDYQQYGKDLISNEFRKGNNRVMLWAQTGAGKGLWMANFVQESTSKGLRVLSVMRRREIIFQTGKNYKKYYGIESNLIMGSIRNNNQHLSTVASIDTLRNRIKNPKYGHLKDVDVVIIDECHDLTSSTYKRLIWFLEGYDLDEYNDKDFEANKQYFRKIYIGLTATPFRVGRQTHTFWQSVVKPIEAHELRDRGFLTHVKVFAPKKIDVTGIRMTGSDYNQKELFERVSKLQVIGDVVETYKQLGQNKPAIMFCVNQAHSKIMAQAFNEAGIPAVHCDADHSQAERDAAVAGLKSGKYKILCNCNIFSTGFDAPFVEVLIGGRPSDSENLTLQQWGRVLRPFKVCANCHTEYGGDNSCYQCGSSQTSYVKEYAIILDHANNTDRWGLPYDIRQPELEPIDRTRKGSSGGSGVKTCPKCFAVVPNIDRYCGCGHDFVEASEQNQAEQVVNVAGELHEVDANFLKEQLFQKIKQRYNTYKRLEMLRHWGPNSKFYKLYEEFGDDLWQFSSSFGIPVKVKNQMKKNELYDGLDGLHDAINNSSGKNDKVIT